MIMPVVAPKLVYGATSVRGWWLYHWLSIVPLEQAMGVVKQVLSLMVEGKLVLEPGRAFALKEVEQAVRYTQTKEQGGKALLVG